MDQDGMTLVLAWRDPFCLVSDDVATGLFGGKSSVGAKIKVISDGLALGTAGYGDFHGEIVELVGALPVADWTTLARATQEIVDDVTANTQVPGCR
jgi:hypothetical protein